MKEKNRFLNIYLKISIVVAFLSLFSFLKDFLLSSFGGTIVPNAILVSLVAMKIIYNLILYAYFILSIVALIIFVKNKLNKLNLVIPLIEIIGSSISLILGIIYVFIDVSNIFVGISYLNPPLDIFILFFALFLLKKFKR